LQTNAEDIRNEGSVRQTVSITSETLTETGQNLVNWVADSYGHPVSYTEANTGDKFILYVDGGSKLTTKINFFMQTKNPNFSCLGFLFSATI